MRDFVHRSGTPQKNYGHVYPKVDNRQWGTSYASQKRFGCTLQPGLRDERPRMNRKITIVQNKGIISD